MTEAAEPFKYNYRVPDPKRDGPTGRVMAAGSGPVGAALLLVQHLQAKLLRETDEETAFRYMDAIKAIRIADGKLVIYLDEAAAPEVRMLLEICKIEMAHFPHCQSEAMALHQVLRFHRDLRCNEISDKKLRRLIGPEFAAMAYALEKNGSIYRTNRGYMADIDRIIVQLSYWVVRTNQQKLDDQIERPWDEPLTYDPRGTAEASRTMWMHEPPMLPIEYGPYPVPMPIDLDCIDKIRRERIAEAEAVTAGTAH